MQPRRRIFARFLKTAPNNEKKDLKESMSTERKFDRASTSKEKALEHYEAFQEAVGRPDVHPVVAALKACTSMRDVRRVHAGIPRAGLEQALFVATTLVDVYGKLGSIGDARVVFDGMFARDTVSWNALISGYAHCGYGDLALKLYFQMQEDGFMPNGRTYVAALGVCASLAGAKRRYTKLSCLTQGVAIHRELLRTGDEQDVFVVSSLVDMYSKCGSLTKACFVFNAIPNPTSVIRTAMILGYAQNGEGKLALALFDTMVKEGVKLDPRTFVGALNACSSLADEEQGSYVDGKLVKVEALAKGRAVHLELKRRSQELNVFLGSSLVDMYCKCGSMSEARLLFHNLQHDLVSWNAIIMGYAQSGDGELALQMFATVQDVGLTPNDRTLVAALVACSSLAAEEEAKLINGSLVKASTLEKGRRIHAQVKERGYEGDNYIANSLVDMYTKCGSLNDARQVFDAMEQRCVISWTSMILGYSQNGEYQTALDLFKRMQGQVKPGARTFVAALSACAGFAEKEEGEQINNKLVKPAALDIGRTIHSQAAVSREDSDVFVANSLVDMYTACGSTSEARQVFDEMRESRKNFSPMTWSTMIHGYAENGENELAVELYSEMQDEGLVPDGWTFVAALKACGNLVALEAGREVHSNICKAGLELETLVANSLVAFYGRCGRMTDAEVLFESLGSSRRSLVTYSAVIMGYSQLGEAQLVFDVFERMQSERVRPDSVTFLSVLKVCSHAGLVGKGKKYFQLMSSAYGISPSVEHFTCIIDLLGRANHLEEAVKMARSMPFQADVTIWVSILAACHKWRNLEAGKIAFECMQKLDQHDSAAYVLMANLLASHEAETSEFYCSSLSQPL